MRNGRCLSHYCFISSSCHPLLLRDSHRQQEQERSRSRRGDRKLLFIPCFFAARLAPMYFFYWNPKKVVKGKESADSRCPVPPHSCHSFVLLFITPRNETKIQRIPCSFEKNGFNQRTKKQKNWKWTRISPLLLKGFSNNRGDNLFVLVFSLSKNSKTKSKNGSKIRIKTKQSKVCIRV